MAILHHLVVPEQVPPFNLIPTEVHLYLLYTAESCGLSIKVNFCIEDLHPFEDFRDSFHCAQAFVPTSKCGCLSLS